MKRTVTLWKGNGMPFLTQRPQRNEPCSCGSGKKAKRCCGDETKFYIQEKKNRTMNEEES